MNIFLLMTNLHLLLLLFYYILILNLYNYFLLLNIMVIQVQVPNVTNPGEFNDVLPFSNVNNKFIVNVEHNEQ